MRENTGNREVVDLDIKFPCHLIYVVICKFVLFFLNIWKDAGAHALSTL